MNTENAITKKAKRANWANHIKNWQSSGESQSDYCRRNQLVPHQFTYWKQIFNVNQKSRPPTEPGFVSVQLTRSLESSEPEMVIQLPNGIRIESAQSNNLELIQAMARWQL